MQGGGKKARKAFRKEKQKEKEECEELKRKIDAQPTKPPKNKKNKQSKKEKTIGYSEPTKENKKINQLFNKSLKETNINKSIGYLNEILKKYPSNQAALYRKAILLFKLKKFQNSLDCLGELTSLNVKHSEAWYTKGIIYDLYDYYDFAFQSYKKAILYDDTHVDALYNIIDLILEKEIRKPETAIPFLEKIIEMFEKDTKSILKLAECYNKQCRYIDAFSLLNWGLKNNPNNKQINKAKNKTSNLIHLREYFEKAEYFESRNQYYKAVEYYGYILCVNTHHKKAYYRKGMLYYQLNRYDDALEVFNKGLKKPDISDTNCKKMYFKRGEILEKLNKLEQAINNYQDGIAKVKDLNNYRKIINEYNDKTNNFDPNYIELWMKKGYLYFELGELKKAVQIFSDVLEISPKYKKALILLGKTYAEEGKYDKALKVYNKAFDMFSYEKAKCNPKSSEYIKNNYFDLADLYKSKGDLLFLLGYNKEANTSYSKSSELWYELGRFLVPRNKENKQSKEEFWDIVYPLNRIKDFNHGSYYGKAIAFFDLAIKLNPRSINAWYEKGNLLFDMEQFEKALEAYNVVLKINPNYKTALNNKKDTLLKLGRQKEASEINVVENNNREKRINRNNFLDKGDADMWYYSMKYGKFK